MPLSMKGIAGVKRAGKNGWPPRVRCPAMEIHAPHHPVLTVKEALVHLAIITTGILIALSLEGALEEAEPLFNPVRGGSLLSGMSFAFFNTAAYTTAEVTGAFGFMDYSETVRYADTYDLQALYVRMQDGIEKDLFAAATLGSSLLTKPTPTEIEDVKRQLRLALGGLAIIENLANDLNERYSRVLKDAP